MGKTAETDVNEDSGDSGEERQLEDIEDGDDSLTKIVRSIWNLDLFQEAKENISKTDWFLISVTAHHLGFVGLTVWSLFTILIFILNYLFASPSILDGVTRLVQIGPWVPVILFAFAIISNMQIHRLRESYEEKNTVTRGYRLNVFLVTIIALTVAGIFRWGIFNALINIYNTSLGAEGVISAMYVDGGYVSLLLIGIGGFGSLAFLPQDSE